MKFQPLYKNSKQLKKEKEAKETVKTVGGTFLILGAILLLSILSLMPEVMEAIAVLLAIGFIGSLLLGMTSMIVGGFRK